MPRKKRVIVTNLDKVKKDKSAVKKIMEEFEKIDPREMDRRMNEIFREKRDKKEESRKLLESLDRELETGSRCRVCDDAIVEYRTEKIRQRTGMEVYGGYHSAMGILPPINYKSKYYCRNCRIKYEPPLPKSNRT